jgi:ferredoxin
MNTIDIMRFSLLRKLFVSRWPQYLLRLLTLAGFMLVIIAGFLGTPVGSRNFGIIAVWIAWWALLILIAVPLLGRLWCSVCPIPLAGEWLQQGALLGPNGRQQGWGLARQWPRQWRHIWLQNAAFLLLAMFSTVVLTRPIVTAVLLAALILLATLTALVYERRAFCRYLCPVGGFIGLYAQAAPIELRVRDTAVCATHKTKTCYTGNENGYGCPWNVFPAGLVKNTNCGLCMECIRTCPRDNIAIQIRPFGTDLAQPRGRRLDEAYKGLIMLGSAAVYAAVMLGPWGGLKTAAYQIGSLSWWGFVAAFLLFVLGILPGGLWLATTASRRLVSGRRSARQAFIAFAYALVPLGLTAWIAFSLSFVFANISYLWPLLSDPMGWGWNLWGTVQVGWTPYLSHIVPLLQAGILLVGLGWSCVTAYRIALEDASVKTAVRAASPIMVFCMGVTIGLLWLLVG